MNELTIRHTFDLMKADNDLVEVRVISGKSIYSGYFKSVEKLIEELKRYQTGNIYFVLNEISDACYSRDQRDFISERAKVTTGDSDITKRNWLLIDVDPIRPTGVSSSDEEKNNSKETINKVFAFLRDAGFSAPIVCDSGNGYHLLYKIDLENTKENTEIIKTFLQVLDMYFSNPNCAIDKVVFNAARITKLYGTIARKGNDTVERPHRESKILRFPDDIKVTPRALIEKIAEQYPKPEPKQFNNNYQSEAFDLDSFISKHNIPVKSEQSYAGGTKYNLDHCLFDENHKGKDAALFKFPDGKIVYKCLHNSCEHYHWKDVRLKYEPDAYDKKHNPDNFAVGRVNKKSEIKVEPQPIIPEIGKKFLSIAEVQNVDRSQIISMPSGFEKLDKKIIGFNKGEVTVWSGKNGSAKSTILNQVALNTIQAGFRGAIFSGELQAYKLKNWLYLQAAGRQYTRESDKFEGVYFVPKEIAAKIDKWLDNKLFIYNNSYGTNYRQLLEDFKEIIVEQNLDWVIFDNLMALDLDDDGYNVNKQQKKFILEVSSVSKEKNIHSHIVAHPRKDVGFLRKESISGSADLSNAVENVIICHRNNNDYKKAIGDYFDKWIVESLTQFSNYIEVCKNRDLGIMDFMVGLHYEKESKRLLNEEYSNPVYDWQDIESEQMRNFNQQSVQPKVEKNDDIPINTSFYEPKDYKEEEDWSMFDASEILPF
jgi:KaiC/GvpD/RAD55 family RecA-like ATPase